MTSETMTTIILSFFGGLITILLSLIAWAGAQWYSEFKKWRTKVDSGIQSAQTKAECGLKEGNTLQEIHELAALLRALIAKLPSPRRKKGEA